MHKMYFTISLFHASTYFEHHVLIVRRSKLYYAACGIITPVGGRPVHNLCTGRPRSHIILPHAPGLLSGPFCSCFRNEHSSACVCLSVCGFVGATNPIMSIHFHIYHFQSAYHADDKTVIKHFVTNLNQPTIRAKNNQRSLYI